MMVALVTGATSGFGAAIARRIVAEGGRVIAAGRRRERLLALRSELGPAVHPLELDVRERRSLAEALAGLPADFASIDVFVANAGLAWGMEPAQRADLEDWETMIATNVAGLAYGVHAVLPGMLARERGHVVLIGSTAASYPYPGGNVYGATKAFVAQLARNLRADLVGTPIRVTEIAPGLSGGTEFSQTRFHGDEAKASAVYAGAQPLTAEDVADAVGWAITRPAHVNINAIELMPTTQAAGPLAVHRTS